MEFAGADDLQQRARQMALAMRSQTVLTAEDEQMLWWVLHRHATTAPAAADGVVAADGSQADGLFEDGGGSSAGVSEPSLNYDDFVQVASECREAIGPAADAYFQASTFLRLGRDAGGRVPAATLFRYCTMRSAQIQLRVELGMLDAAGSGALSPSQLLAWLERRAPLAACCEALASEADWCTAVAARLLLLHGRRARVVIRELLASPEVMELGLALHAWDAADAAAQAAAAAAAEAEAGGTGGAAAVAAAAPQAAQLAAALSAQQGWFSPAAVAALRSRFAELDADGDGLLTQADFSTFTGGAMTQLFIQRLFSQHCTRFAPSAGGSYSGGGSGSSGYGGMLRHGSPPSYAAIAGGSGVGASAGGHAAAGSFIAAASPGSAPLMDFAAFCTFCAAWEQRHAPAAVRYFFQVLDLEGKGHLGPADLYTFFREVHVLWVAAGQYAELRIEDVVGDVIDLAQAANPQRITAAVLQRCGAAGTIIGLLADVNLFYEYENREQVLAQAAQAAQEQQAAA